MRFPTRLYVETIEHATDPNPRVRYTGPFWTRLGAARALALARAAAPVERPEETLLRLVTRAERLAHLADPTYPPPARPAVVDVRDTAPTYQETPR